MTLIQFLAGLAVLILGAEVLVRGASRLSLSLGVPPLVVGLTVVAFGTSAPELAVTLGGVVTGKTDLAMGNVVGSNIFNVLFILGLSALIAPLVVDRQLVRQEVPIVIALSALTMVLALDTRLSMPDGAVLVASLAAYSLLLYRQGKRAPAVEMADPLLPVPRRGPIWDLAAIIAGLALLVLGSRWLVAAATDIALGLGISETVVGLTIVAAGTSLPEVATSVVAAARGEREIAVGNVLGSSIFNLGAVLGFGALFAGGNGLPVAPSLLAFDLPVMVAVAVACLPVLFTGHLIARWEGALFFGYYLAYTAWLVLYSQHHDALDEYGLVMRMVVIPLTVATLAAVAWREWRARRRAG
ncbi:calcium/sodium antiporter [Arenimonas fontis]|uniref:Calcium/sodium antiporter n=1 Tax=Arenimonas fontis TaxID=2608255 RepID=A0A5B2ZCY6_9GAMM|nr:calcium/sodium antiporter [Arenimonas fontis]KAA2285785.1 calcium/sodium antiporter [Arenimonas fontis]